VRLAASAPQSSLLTAQLLLTQPHASASKVGLATTYPLHNSLSLPRRTLALRCPTPPYRHSHTPGNSRMRTSAASQKSDATPPGHDTHATRSHDRSNTGQIHIHTSITRRNTRTHATALRGNWHCHATQSSHTVLARHQITKPRKWPGDAAHRGPHASRELNSPRPGSIARGAAWA